MVKKEFKKYRSNITKQTNRRWELLTPLVKQYGSPILVHAVKDTTIFSKILEEGIIKIPSEHNSPKKNRT